jgi:hypothetical protein
MSKDPVADWVLASTMLKSAQFLPKLTTHVSEPFRVILCSWRPWSSCTTISRLCGALIGLNLRTRTSSTLSCENGWTRSLHLAQPMLPMNFDNIYLSLLRNWSDLVYYFDRNRLRLLWKRKVKISVKIHICCGFTMWREVQSSKHFARS